MNDSKPKESITNDDVVKFFGFFLIAFGTIFGGIGLLLTLTTGAGFTLAFAIGGGVILLTGIVLAFVSMIKAKKTMEAPEAEQPIQVEISGGTRAGKTLWKSANIDLSYDIKSGEGNILAAMLCGIGFLITGGVIILFGTISGISMMSIPFILFGGIFVGLGIYAIVLWLVRRNRPRKTAAEQFPDQMESFEPVLSDPEDTGELYDYSFFTRNPRHKTVIEQTVARRGMRNALFLFLIAAAILILARVLPDSGEIFAGKTVFAMLTLVGFATEAISVFLFIRAIKRNATVRDIRKYQKLIDRNMERDVSESDYAEWLAVAAKIDETP